MCNKYGIPYMDFMDSLYISYEEMDNAGHGSA